MNATRRSLFALLAGGAFAVAAGPVFAEEIIIREHAMPPLRVEVIPERPHPGWFFVKGHWHWADNRGWIWIGGRWIDREVPAMPELIVETPPPAPSPRHFWVRGHWFWEGNHWQWARGHWVV